MKILVLNGSPRSHGNTAAMTAAFAKGARENGHWVDVVNVCQKKIAGCLACEYCRQENTGHERRCVQQDDMQEIYPLLDEAEMIVLASPIYYHSFSGQLQCVINRIYALDQPKKLKKAALFLSSESDHVYGGAIYEYQNSFLFYLHLEDMGIFTACGEQNRSPEKLEELYQFGQSLPKEERPSFSMTTEEFLAAFENGQPVRDGSDVMRYAGWMSHQAMRLTSKLNSEYHTSEEIQKLFSELIGKQVDNTFGLFPPFYTDCGKNITIGKMCLLTVDAGSRIKEVLRSGTEP